MADRPRYSLRGIPNDTLTNDIVNERRFKVSGDNSKTAFGELLVSNETPITQVSSEYGLLGVLTAALGGTTTITDRLFTSSTGTGTNNVAAIISSRESNQRPGQGLSCKLSALFTTGKISSTQQAGLISSESAFAFGYDGDSFGIVYGSKGQLEAQSLQITNGSNNETATITIDGFAHSISVTNSSIQQNAFEISQELNLVEPRYRFSSNDNTVIALARLPDFGTGAFEFSSNTMVASWTEITAGLIPEEVWYKKEDWNVNSNVNIDTTKLNDFKIQLQGNINFYVKDSESGEYVLVHVIKYINTSIAASVSNPTFRVGWAARNTGNNTDVIVKGGYGATFIEGMVKYNQVPKGKSNTQLSVGTTATNILSFRNRSVFKGVANRAEIIPLLLSIGTDSTKPVIFEIVANPQTTDFLNWEYLDFDTSIMEFSVSDVSITGDVIAVFVFSSGGENIDMSKILDFQIPTSEFSITARKNSGANTDITASGTWKEDL